MEVESVAIAFSAEELDEQELKYTSDKTQQMVAKILFIGYE